IQYSNEKEERLQQLYKAINHLTEIERAIVMLYLEDKSYEEMEDILGINQNNLRVKMNRIKEKLRKLTKSVEHGVRYPERYLEKSGGRRSSTRPGSAYFIHVGKTVAEHYCQAE